MSTLYKILGQLAPAITNEEVLYTVPANTWSEFYVYWCEDGNAAATFRISISAAGGATASKDYILYDFACIAYGGDKIGPLFAQGGNVVRVYASTADMNFTATGKEYIVTGA